MPNEQQNKKRRRASSDCPCGTKPTTLAQEHFDVLNLLVHPVWVFDIKTRSMAWANSAAVSLWNADSLESLLSRSFADMSEATVSRLENYLKKFAEGESIIDQWTFYPKGEAKTIQCTCSGIKVPSIVNHDCMSMLVEGVPLLKEEIKEDSLRSVEMLRHLPMAVCQFDMMGNAMFQNPEALNIYGTPPNLDDNGTNDNKDQESKDSTDAPNQTSEKKAQIQLPKADSHFLNLFVDKKVGENAFAQMQMDKDFSVEAQSLTRQGPRWSAIILRKVKDPVTAKPVMLFSAKDITENVRAKKEIQATLRKSEFFAIMAHEIRTPLHQVNGFIDLLNETKLSLEQQSFVKVLKSSANTLLTVINDVLDYSKLEAGKMKLESIPFEPKAVVEGSLEAVRPTIEEKGLYLESHWPRDIPFKALGDPNRLRQILLNLLQNAAKFTNTGGIKVNTEKIQCQRFSEGLSEGKKTSNGLQSFLKFSVTDTGIGISQEQQKRIFIKYQQAETSVARTYGGTGLGLSICRSLAVNMGGTIGVTSEVGVGATFWFTVPLVEVTEETETDKAVPESGSKSSSSSSANDVDKLHILVVEDNKVNQKLVVKMLHRMGHTTVVAENGKVAIDCIQDQEKAGVYFDAVLMDIQMPVMDGIEATKRLRSLGWTDLPVLGLTASVHRADYKEIGFDDWISKPIPMRDLKAKLNRLVQIKKERAASVSSGDAGRLLFSVGGDNIDSAVPASANGVSSGHKEVVGSKSTNNKAFLASNGLFLRLKGNICNRHYEANCLRAARHSN